MTAEPLDNFLVEVLEEQPTTINTTDSSGSEVIVELAKANIVGQPITPELIEVAIVPPVGSGVRFIENIPFTRQGPLSTSDIPAEYPIGPGQYTIESISARVGVAPTGSSVVIDILKNDISIFDTIGDQPTISAGQQNAVVGTYDPVMLAEGDWIEVTIDQVGSVTPGETLVVSIRLERLA